MKIVLVSKELPPSPRSYGIGTYTHETAQGLARLGHQVSVICAADTPAVAGFSTQGPVSVIRLVDDELAPSGWTRHVWPKSEAALNYRRRVAECLDRLIDDNAAEIVEFPGYRGESHVWARGPRRIPMVVRMHGFTAWVDGNWKDVVSAERRLQRRLETEELLAADRITLVAGHLRTAVTSRLPAHAQVTTVYNSIETRVWADAARVAAPAPGIGAGDIVFAGSHTRVKGIFDLIEAVEQLRQHGRWSGQLHLFGRSGGEFTRFVRKRWGAARLPDYITAHGSVARETLAAVYRDAGVCCFPSRIEPFGYTVVEASASRALVIGSQKTGIEELIVDGRTGFLVEPGQPMALLAALERVLSMDKETAEQMRSAAQEHVAAEFDSRVILARLVNVYREVVLQKNGEGVTQCC